MGKDIHLRYSLGCVVRTLANVSWGSEVSEKIIFLKLLIHNVIQHNDTKKLHTRMGELFNRKCSEQWDKQNSRTNLLQLLWPLT